MFQTTVNQTLKSSIDLADLNWDILPLGNGKFHILQDNQSYEATLISADYTNKSLHIKINKNSYQVAVKDQFDQLIDQLGFATTSSKKLNNIKAPMPGLVLDILVKKGDTIQAGDSVLILEAMKMENVLKAEGEAIVKEITVDKGNAVDKNQILIEFE
jgi:biotin carboxyl carrier protein